MVNVPKLVKRRLSDILLEEGLLKEDLLNEALNRQKASGEPLPTVLQKMGVLAEIDLARAIAKQYNLPYLDASRYQIPRDVMDAIPIETLQQHQFVPLDKIGKCLLLSISNIPAVEILETLERQTGSQFFIYVSTVTQVNTTLKKIMDVKSGVKPAAPAPKTGAIAKPGTAPAPATPAAGLPKPQTAVRPVQGLPSPLAGAPPSQTRPASGVFPRPSVGR